MAQRSQSRQDAGVNAMPSTKDLQIEQRLADLEKQVAQLQNGHASKKDWESTVGMWKDDELSRQMDRLGAEWRKSVTD